MSRPSIVIDIIHKCTVYDIAVLTIFTSSHRPNILSFDLKDNLKLLPQDGYMLGYRQIAIAGEYHIKEGITEDNVAGLISELVDDILAQYLAQSLTVSLPERNMQYGLN